MLHHSRLTDVVITALLFGLTCSPSFAQSAIVARVVDGDSCRLADGRTLDLLGIKAPALTDPHGETSKVMLKLYVQGREVELRSSLAGKWGQPIRAHVVWEGIDINGLMVRQGHAQVVAAEHHLKSWNAAEATARNLRLGRWRVSVGAPQHWPVWTQSVEAISLPTPVLGVLTGH